MALWRVSKFRRSSGVCPVDDYLGSAQVSAQDRRRVDTRVRMIQSVEQIPGEWVVDYKTTNLQRLKPNCQHRFLCIRLEDEKHVILLCGTLKQKKNLPADKINEAETMLSECEQGEGDVEDYKFD